MTSKQQLRKQVLDKLRSLSPSELHEYEMDIYRRFIDQKVWSDAATIGITISREFEIDTSLIIENGWAHGKKIVVPKTNKETRTMEFFQISSFDMLEETYAGLFEPSFAADVPVEKHKIDLLIVPGVAFDLNGYRLGFGGGYYDRYLQDFKGTTCALALEEQIFKQIPVDSHDLPVQMIVSPKDIYFA